MLSALHATSRRAGCPLAESGRRRQRRWWVRATASAPLAHSTAMATKEQGKKEIFTYEAPWVRASAPPLLHAMPCSCCLSRISPAPHAASVQCLQNLLPGTAPCASLLHVPYPKLPLKDGALE
ncbi:MAG: hypothetical protein ACPIOQ_69735 [Promethearchaeia archaeon]